MSLSVRTLGRWVRIGEELVTNGWFRMFITPWASKGGSSQKKERNETEAATINQSIDRCV